MRHTRVTHVIDRYWLKYSLYNAMCAATSRSLHEGYYLCLSRLAWSRHAMPRDASSTARVTVVPRSRVNTVLETHAFAAFTRVKARSFAILWKIAAGCANKKERNGERMRDGERRSERRDAAYSWRTTPSHWGMHEASQRFPGPSRNRSSLRRVEIKYTKTRVSHAMRRLPNLREIIAIPPAVSINVILLLEQWLLY